MTITESFVLASSSPRRRDLLASLGIRFSVIKPDINEDQHPGEPPRDYARRLSQEKAAAVVAQVEPGTMVLAADTVVIDGDIILGKPASIDEARDFLRRLRQRSHEVCTAFTLRRADVVHTGICCTTVYMRDYTDAEIDAYIQTGDPFDKAGGYAIQHPTFAPVTHIEGSYANVVGLPVESIADALNALGWKNG